MAQSLLGPALLALSLLGAPETGAQEAVRVANDRYEVEIVRAERRDALMNGMLRPEDPGQAFLLVFLDTEDPCLDPQPAASCFDGEVEADEKLAWACGWLVLADGEESPADGGGVLDGELACSYVVPRRSKRLTLVLRGYPEVELEPAASVRVD